MVRRHQEPPCSQRHQEVLSAPALCPPPRAAPPTSARPGLWQRTAGRKQPVAPGPHPRAPSGCLSSLLLGCLGAPEGEAREDP